MLKTAEPITPDTPVISKLRKIYIELKFIYNNVTGGLNNSITEECFVDVCVLNDMCVCVCAYEK